MNIQEFKSNIKEVLKGQNNIEFTIYNNGLETYTTKNSFGLRLLDLFNDSTVKEIVVTSFEEKGYYGTVVNGFYTLLNSGKLNLSKLGIKVYR